MLGTCSIATARPAAWHGAALSRHLFPVSCRSEMCCCAVNQLAIQVPVKPAPEQDMNVRLPGAKALPRPANTGCFCLHTARASPHSAGRGEYPFVPPSSSAVAELMPHENLLFCCEMGMGDFGHGLLFEEKTGHCSFALYYLLPQIIF